MSIAIVIALFTSNQQSSAIYKGEKKKRIATLTRSQVRHWTELTMVPSKTSEMTLRYFFWRLFFGGENVVTAVRSRGAEMWAHQFTVRFTKDSPAILSHSHFLFLNPQCDLPLIMTMNWAPGNRSSVPFLCAGFKLSHPEVALGGLQDILGMCPSIATGLCGLVMLDIWISGKQSKGEQTVVKIVHLQFLAEVFKNSFRLQPQTWKLLRFYVINQHILLDNFEDLKIWTSEKCGMHLYSALVRVHLGMV